MRGREGGDCSQGFVNADGVSVFEGCPRTCSRCTDKRCHPLQLQLNHSDSVMDSSGCRDVLHGATCVLSCSPGYYGPPATLTCDTARSLDLAGTIPTCRISDPCHSGPCLHDGVCIKRSHDAYRCDCVNSFSDSECGTCQDDASWQGDFGTTCSNFAIDQPFHDYCYLTTMSNSEQVQRVLASGHVQARATTASESCPMACGTKCGAITRPEPGLDKLDR